MRELPSTVLGPDEKASPLRLLQVLTLSHHPDRSFISISPPRHQSSQAHEGSNGTGEASTVVAVPNPTHTEEFLQLMRSRMGPLWTSRQAMTVTNGAAFEFDDFKVRIGDLRQGQGAQPTRGVIVEVEWLADGEDYVGEAEEMEDGARLLRELWAKLELHGGREIINVPGMGSGGKGMCLARQYCELLRY